jgi:serine/threonine protein kinase/Tol biopolymer transport system component
VPDSDNDDITRSHIQVAHGSIIGHYRIIEKIGAGGMGEVYLAEDTKLDRQVALKFLPPHLCQDPECRARFTREAQAAAKLDHPNIVGVHEVGEYNGRPFFSMQHVEGQTLREAIKGKPLALDRILEIAIQACDGLQAAHEKGVTHRDIKPSNILIDSHGRVRIVDFGLASILGADQLTKTGSTLGTVGYMSPEQVRGERVDHRTDLFSLGVVLYELLTSESPFKCDTEAATLNAITNTKPELLTRFRREMPPELQTIADKALDKNVGTRYQHADEMAADLKRLLEALTRSTHSQMNAIPIATRKHWPVIVAVGGALVVFLAIAWLWHGSGDRGVSPKLAKQKQITFSGDIQLVDISPDGSKLAFVRGDESLHRLYTYSFAGGDPLLVFEGGVVDMAWSPDGNAVLAAAVNFKDTAMGVFLVPFMGGSPRLFPVRLCGPCRLSWDPSGAAFYYHESCGNPRRFLRFDVKTGDSAPYPLSMPIRWVQGIKCSPKGDRLLLEVDSDSGGTIWTCRPDGSDSRMLLHTSCMYGNLTRWSPDGRAVYFVRVIGESRDLMKQGIDPRTGEAVGAPRVLVSGLATEGSISTTREGTKLAYVRVEESSAFLLWSRHQVDGKTEYAREVVGTSSAGAWMPCFSPDGSKVAYGTMRNNVGVLCIFSVADRTTRHLDVAGRDIAACVWSPDGNTLAVTYDDSSNRRICLADANSGGLLPMPSTWAALTLSRDMSWAPLEMILIQDVGNRNFYKLDPKSEKVELLLPDDSMGWAFVPTPSMRYGVAIDWNQVEDGIWCVSLDGAQRTRVIKGDEPGDYSSLEPLCWSDDEEHLYWRGNGRYILKTSRDGSVTDTVLDLGPDASYAVTMTRDAAQVFTIKREATMDAWLIEHFDPDVK